MEDWDLYCKAAWATYLEVLAAARHYDTAIVVVPADPGIPMAVACGSASRRITLFWDGRHFDWLQPAEEHLPKELMQVDVPLTSLC